MKPTDLKNKTNQELNNLLREYRGKLSNFSFELEASALKDSSQIKKTKKEIARILTLLTSQNS